MKKYILVLGLLFPIMIYGQTTITIGTDTSTSLYGPIYIFSSSSTSTHSWNLSIYDQSEIVNAGGYAGNFSSISWYKTDSGAYNDPDGVFEIYVKHTTLNNFASAADFNNEVVGAMLVYSSITQRLSPQTGWLDFTFSNNFSWNGIDNIMVLTRWVRIGNATDAVHWQTSPTLNTRVSHSFSTTSSMGTLYTSLERPNIRIVISPQAADDAGVVSLDSIRGRCPGLVEIYATIRNYGSNTINSALVNWEIDGAPQTPFTFTDPLASGATTQLFLGTIVYISGVSHDFKAWTSDPNGVPDTNNVNDTVFVNAILPGLSGSYTIGAGGDFSSFSNAFEILQNNGVCGAVDVSVDPGIYTEQLILRPIPNASAISDITFRSSTNDSSSVSIQWPSSTSSDSNYVISINAAHFINFVSLGFERTGTNTNSTVVEMTNGAGDLRFMNNYFVGPTGFSSANSSGSQSAIFSDGSVAWDGLEVGNNYFAGNSNGVWINGGSSAYAKNTWVHNNVFETFYVGVFLLYQEGPVVNFNEFNRSNTTSAIDYYAISLRYISNSFIIMNNKIHGFTGSNGIRVRASTLLPGNRGLIANNFVYLYPAGTGRGISVEESSASVDVFHNSVNYAGTNATLGRAFYVDGSATSDIRILNNIFANTGGGYTTYISANAFSGIAMSNYNCLYSTGASLGFYNSAYANLSAIQSGTFLELNSVSADPNFLSASDLHTTAGFLGDAGSPVPGIIEDIDGEQRDITHPDIGADEFTPVGIHKSPYAVQINIYPNPAKDYMAFEVGNNNFSELEYVISDLTGREIKAGRLNHTGRTVIDVADLASGVYVIGISSTENILQQSIGIIR